MNNVSVLIGILLAFIALLIGYSLYSAGVDDFGEFIDRGEDQVYDFEEQQSENRDEIDAGVEGFSTVDPEKARLSRL